MAPRSVDAARIVAAAAAEPPRPLPPLPPAQAAALAELELTGDLAVDTVAARAGIGVEVAVAALLELELAGWAIRAPGGGYRRGGP